MKLLSFDFPFLGLGAPVPISGQRALLAFPRSIAASVEIRSLQDVSATAFVTLECSHIQNATIKICTVQQKNRTATNNSLDSIFLSCQYQSAQRLHLGLTRCCKREPLLTRWLTCSESGQSAEGLAPKDSMIRFLRTFYRRMEAWLNEYERTTLWRG